ncbi:MAG: hypothetical protein HC890_13100 [Chloroflexaceae bacterium]|nr:hypothetical protein [Chloroflexaceae bacterium]
MQLQSLPIPNKLNLENTVATTLPLLSKSEARDLIASCGELGIDPSSEHFVERTKNVAYVMFIQGQCFQLRASCFIQPDRYNDFSGGYKRCYQEMPATFLACEATQKSFLLLSQLTIFPMANSS